MTLYTDRIELTIDERKKFDEWNEIFKNSIDWKMNEDQLILILWIIFCEFPEAGFKFAELIDNSEKRFIPIN